MLQRCKYCGCLGWFFSLSKSGLCINCQHLLTMQLEHRRGILQQAQEMTGNPQTRLTRLDVALKNLEVLAEYEKRGIPTIEGSPSRLLRDGQATKDELILSTAVAEMQEVLLQIKGAEDADKKIFLYNNFSLRLQEYRKRIRAPEKLEPLEGQLKASVHQIRLNAHLEHARRAELASQPQRALEHYREALNFIKAGECPEPQRCEQVAKLEAKIKELEPSSTPANGISLNPPSP